MRCIEGYPRLDERTQFTLRMQSHIFDHNKNMTLSYSSATYEGKGQEVSYPVEQFARENNIVLKSWILTQNTYRKPVKHHLSPTLAKELYLEDGKLVGSISAFQMFVNDPYQFFMERGLKIREPEILKFDPRIIGTVNHAVMEYYHDNKNIDPWTDVRKVFPMTHPRYRMIYDRNQDLMEQN
ncbi:PD-(D/E)XK nuclease family protein, partial [Staphylococcus aureus]|uniref:PD-(D/E)XK nuclease family protein n=1 Tax=Staphylococcus aureus TaxID=1280 RepID=UPI0020BDC028